MVLSNPLGIARLMDMASEREVVRNEALLLLNALARGKEDIQKLLAFEGAFEQLFTILRGEGGVAGGVVVQDCLELANNLLRDCAPNQLLFRESGLAASLPALLELPRSAGASLSRQAAANLLCALEMVLVLLTPCGGGEEGRGAVRAHQALLLKSGLLGTLLPLALGERTPFSAVASAARMCAALLVEGQRAG